jgi:predicted nucleic acid-binding protein
VTLAAVSDAGPFIHLAEIDSLELLTTFDTLLVPETVSKLNTTKFGWGTLKKAASG